MQKNLVLAGVLGLILVIVAYFLFGSLPGANQGMNQEESSLSDTSNNNGGSSGPIPGSDTVLIVDQPLEGKSILMIIPPKDFQDQEYFGPKRIFLSSGVKSVLTASTQKGNAIGTGGGEALVNLSLGEVNIADFDAVVFVGGLGVLNYLENEITYEIARDAASQGKLVAGISLGPVILAKAGVLQGKNATVGGDASAISVLQASGAFYKNEPLVKDGNILTAKGINESDEFGFDIVDYLSR